MGSRERTLVVLGPSGAGKATTIGCMLFKYGAIDMMTMDKFQREGIETFEQAANRLKSDGIAPAFDTPKHHVTVLDSASSQADCAILVLPADVSSSEVVLKHLSGGARKLVILVNKMDAINWSEEQFLKIVEGLGNGANIPIIPISATNGDNVVEKSPKSEWFKGSTKCGTTILEALEIAFQI